MRIAAGLLALLVSGTPDQTSDTSFDLVCRGTIRLTAGAVADNELLTEHYRLDLAARRYCRGACDVVRLIRAVDAGRIVLEDAASLPPPPPGTVITVVVRRPGWRLHAEVTAPGLRSIVDGSCVLRPFSGLAPAPAP